MYYSYVLYTEKKFQIKLAFEIFSVTFKIEHMVYTKMLLMSRSKNDEGSNVELSYTNF